MDRQLISSGAKWEAIVGYSRAVRVGPFIHVAGTTAVNQAGEVIGIGDGYQQTKQILTIIQTALAEAGAELEHVVRTRIFVTDISQWEEVGRAHGEFFKEIRPAATMVEVKGLINPDLLVEIEVDAILPD
jgi:enamine deaminase RidA (YjgF/YER057c/UK114 family)